MDTLTLRQKLHSLIDSSPEDKLLEVYSVLEDIYTDDLKVQLDQEYTDYQNHGEVIPKEHVDQFIEQLLYGKK